METKRSQNLSCVGQKSIHFVILDNLYYILCGIDTKLLYIGIKNKKYVLIAPDEYPSTFLRPFESVCVNVRIINKFILKNNVKTESIKKAISEVFLEQMTAYFDIVLDCRKSTLDLEYLYVKLESSIQSFDKMRHIVDICKEAREVEIFNILSDKRHDSFYCRILDVCYEKIEKDIVDWILCGKCNGEFMISEQEVSINDIENSYWGNKYNLVEQQIPYTLKDDAHVILKCGKLINLLYKLNYKLNLDIVFLKTRGLYGLYAHINTISLLISKQYLIEEINILKKYVLMQDMSFYNDLFTDLYNDKTFNILNSYIDVSSGNKKFLYKVNAFKDINNVKFTLSNLDLNNTVFSILGKKLRHKNNQSILEYITISYTPDMLSLLLSRKNILEYELIFRFLFSFSVIQFLLQKYFRFRFAKMVLAFLRIFRSSIFVEWTIYDCNDIDDIIFTLHNVTKKYLSLCYIITADVYLILSNIIDLASSFISLDNKSDCINIDKFEIEFIDLMHHLHSQMQKTTADWMTITNLECFMKCNLMKSK